MKLQHPATFHNEEILDIIKVKDGQALKLSTFVSRIVRYGKKQTKQDPLDYMGDCWELFAEFFFKFFDGDPVKTYISNYRPNVFDVDEGVDGFGDSMFGGPAFIQAKMLANPRSYLSSKTTANLSNVCAEAMMNPKYSGDFKFNGKNIIVFTSGAGVSPSHPMRWANVINNRDISRWVDNHVVFWDNFTKSIIESRESAKNEEYT